MHTKIIYIITYHCKYLHISYILAPRITVKSILRPYSATIRNPDINVNFSMIIPIQPSYLLISPYRYSLGPTGFKYVPLAVKIRVYWIKTTNGDSSQYW